MLISSDIDNYHRRGLGCPLCESRRQMTFDPIPWWRHQMETFSALLALCAGNSPVTGELPTQRPVTRSFDVFFDLRLNKRLSKQSRGWWFETQSRPLWHSLNVITVLFCFVLVWLYENVIVIKRRVHSTLSAKQNGRHFTDILKYIYLYENCYILIQISLKLVPSGPVNNKPTLVQKMDWCRIGDKPSCGPRAV